ncbi:MAG: substrate-binding domain-containing protein, partial [Pseudomonadota bacterium]
MKTITIGAIASLIIGAVALAGPASAQDLKVATSVPSLGFPFFVHMQNQLNAEAEALGGIEVTNSDGQNSTPKQTADLEAFIISGVDGLVISPLDSVAMAPAVRQVVEAGIPVVTIDRRVDGVDGILAHVGADN